MKALEKISQLFFGSESFYAHSIAEGSLGILNT